MTEAQFAELQEGELITRRYGRKNLLYEIVEPRTGGAGMEDEGAHDICRVQGGKEAAIQRCKFCYADLFEPVAKK